MTQHELIYITPSLSLSPVDQQTRQPVLKEEVRSSAPSQQVQVTIEVEVETKEEETNFSQVSPPEIVTNLS